MNNVIVAFDSEKEEWLKKSLKRLSIQELNIFYRLIYDCLINGTPNPRKNMLFVFNRLTRYFRLSYEVKHCYYDYYCDPWHWQLSDKFFVMFWLVSDKKLRMKLIEKWIKESPSHNFSLTDISTLCQNFENIQKLYKVAYLHEQ